MGYGDTYSIGTATLDNSDAKLVHFSGATLFGNAIALDKLSCEGSEAPISEVGVDYVRLFYDWPGSAFSSVAYVIINESVRWDPQRALATELVRQRERLRIFDFAAPVLPVKAYGVNTPPLDYASDDMLVIGSTPTGAFVGHQNEIAIRTEAAAWSFVTPAKGWSIIAITDPTGAYVVRTWNETSWSANAALSGGGTHYEGDWGNTTPYTNGALVWRDYRIWVANGDTTGDDPLSGLPWRQSSLDGSHGGVPIVFSFSTNTSGSAPASGVVKLNGSASAATIVRISKTDLYGGDRSAQLTWIYYANTSNEKGWMRLAKVGAVADWRALINAIVDQGSYYDISVSFPSAPNGFFSNADQVLFYFEPAGKVGATGATGATGAAGSRGLPGGAVAIPLLIDTSSVSQGDPGNGYVRFNSLIQSSATVIYVDLLSRLGASLQALLDSIPTASTSTVKVSAQLFDGAGAGKFLAFDVTAVGTPAGYRVLTITMLGSSSASPFVHGEQAWLSWVEKGDRGDAGTLAIGAVLTGDPGTAAEATNVGTPSAAILNLKIPRGEKGIPLQPWRYVATLAERDTYGNLDPILSDGNQRTIVVLSDSSNDGKSSLYALKASASPPDPAQWYGPFHPTGITQQEFEDALAERFDPVVMAMMY